MIFYAEKIVKLSCVLNTYFEEPSVFGDDCISPTWCQIYPNKQVGYVLYCSHSFR